MKMTAGLHFILPCIEKMTTIDLRTQVFDVVPQEVSKESFLNKIELLNPWPGADQGLCDRVCGCCGLLQGV